MAGSAGAVSSSETSSSEGPELSVTIENLVSSDPTSVTKDGEVAVCSMNLIY